MSNKSSTNLPSRVENGCQGMEEAKWHFGICYSTFNRLRTRTCHPPSGRPSEVKGERQHAIGHCFCLPHCCLRVTHTNQHPAKCSVIGHVYSVLEWLHAWLHCGFPFEEKGSPSLGMLSMESMSLKYCVRFRAGVIFFLSFFVVNDT